MRALSLLPPLLTLFTLAACGFSLPPEDYAELFGDGVQVEVAEDGARLGRELRDWFTLAGVGEGPGWKLNILSYEEDHDTLSSSARGIVAEYTLYTRVTVEILRGKQRSTHRLSSTRHLRQNFFILNDTLWEEAYLREEMDRQLAMRIAEKMAQQARAARQPKNGPAP